MVQIAQLRLIGTSHISKQSQKEVVDTILELKPTFVAIELDLGRLQGLMGQKKGRISFKEIRKLGIGGLLFALIGAWLQKRLAKMVGSEPGAEMKAAILTAKRVNAKVALIDQDIAKTLRNLFKKVTWKEKFRVVWDIIKGLIFRVPEIESFDLSKVPPEEIIEKMVEIVRKRYPSFYKVMIDDRNKYMSKRLLYLMRQHPTEPIVAVVGAGHKKGMVEIIRKSIVS